MKYLEIKLKGAIFVIEIKTITIKDMNLQEKIDLLLSLTDKFLFIEYYTHTKKNMWKIENIFTKYGQEIGVLYATDEPFEKSLDAAIEYISKSKEKFFNN